MKVSVRPPSIVPAHVSVGYAVWVQYTWELSRIPVSVAVSPAYLLRVAGPEEVAIVCRIAATALSAEAADAGVAIAPGALRSLLRRIRTTFNNSQTRYLVAESAGRIIGVSGVARSHWSGEHLLTGIRVLPRHWDTGIEEVLLARSLGQLRDWGVARAVALTPSTLVAPSTLTPSSIPAARSRVPHAGL